MNRKSVHLFLILVVTFLTFSNCLHNSYHLDDFYRIDKNPGIQELSLWTHLTNPRTMSTLDRIAQFRPLLPWSLALNYHFFGESLPAFHVTNVLLQTLASILMYFVCLQLLRHSIEDSAQRGLLAFFASLFFAIHPVSGVLVNYLCSRDLLLMQVFFLAAFLVYMRMRAAERDSYGSWGVILGFLVLSILSKTNTVAVPLVFAAYEFFLRGTPLFSRTFLKSIFLPGGVLLAYFLYTSFALDFSDVDQVVKSGDDWWQYPQAQLRLHIFYYLRNFFYPFPMRAMPDVVTGVPWVSLQVVFGGVMIAASLWYAWRQRMEKPLVGFCIIAYWVMLAPTSSIAPFHQLAVDYRPYPGSGFFFLLLVLGGAAFLREQKSQVILGSILSLYFMGSSYYMNTHWESEESLYAHAVAQGTTPTGHLNYAMAIKDRSDPRVEKHLRIANQRAPGYVLSNINLGLLLLGQGKTEEGMRYCARGAEIAPRWAQAHFWHSKCLEMTGQRADSYAAALKAARFDPYNVKYRYRAARFAQQNKDFERSLELLKKIPETYERAQFLRGFAYQMLGQRQRAIQEYGSYLFTHEADYQARFNKAFAHMKEQEHIKAIEGFQKVLGIRPSYKECYFHLATAFRALGNDAQAAVMMEKYKG